MIQTRLGPRAAASATRPLVTRLLATWLLAMGLLAIWLLAGASPAGAQQRMAAGPSGTDAGSAEIGPQVWSQSTGRPGAEASGGRRLLIRLPAPHMDARGELIARPQVQVVPIPGSTAAGPLPAAGITGSGTSPAAPSAPGSTFQMASVFQQPPPAGQVPLPESMPAPYGTPLGPLEEIRPGEMILSESGQPMFGDLVHESLAPRHQRHSFLSRWFGLYRSPYEDRGLGYERVGMAPMELDITQPMNNLRFRFDNAYGFEFPDRAEFFWAKVGGRGPDKDQVAINEQVNYQEIRYMWEVAASPNVSLQTELPVRFLDPQDMFYNTTGLGDMSITTKLLMMDGRRTQITQYFRTYLPTGAPGHGLGTGHTSLEPGFLFRYMWTDATYLHGELKYWIPLGGDPAHSGQVFRWGAGISHLWYEADSFAIIPTLELVSWTVMDGQKTILPAVPLAIEVDGETTVNIYPGMRFTWDTGGDLGLFELGLQGGFTITETSWYSGLFRIEARFVY